MEEKRRTESKGNGNTTSRKRKIPGPASKTLKKRHCDNRVETEKTSTSTRDGHSLETTEKPKATKTPVSSIVESPPCQFCLNPNTTRAPDADPHELVKIYRNLCNQAMKQNQEEFPTQLFSQMFPFCVACENYVEQLWQFQEILEKTQLQINETISTIQTVVADAVVLNLDISTPFSTSSDEDLNQKPFTKLRDVLFKDYQSKLREQKLLKPISQSVAIATKEPATVNGEQRYKARGDDLTNTGNGADNDIKMKWEVVDLETSGSDGDDVTDSNCIPALKRKDKDKRNRAGVLTIEDGSFEVYWKTSNSHQQDTAYLECSQCSYEVPFPRVAENGMEPAYQKIKMHALLMHSQEVWKKSSSIPSPLPCRYCTVNFKESRGRDRHEFNHHRSYETVNDPGLLTPERRGGFNNSMSTTRVKK